MTINPGDSTEVFYNWDMTNNSVPIPTGNYEVTGFYACSNPTPVSVNFEYSEVDAVDETCKYSNLNLSNYPNPFNPETTIEMNIPVAGKTKLIIYNSRGQLVKTLVDNVLDEGTSYVTWNGTDSKGNPISSGIYVYKLDTGNQTATRKMILLK